MKMYSKQSRSLCCTGYKMTEKPSKKGFAISRAVYNKGRALIEYNILHPYCWRNVFRICRLLIIASAFRINAGVQEAWFLIV